MKVGWGGSAVLLVLHVVTLDPRVAAAQSYDGLAYEASEPACPSAQHVRERLDDALRGAPSGELPRIQASISIVREADGYLATVVLTEDGYEERRVLADRDCTVLADTAALVVAVALVPGLDAHAQVSPEPVVLGPVERETASAPELALPAPSDLDRSRGLHGSLWLAAHGSYGVLPGAAFGAELAGSLAIDALRLDLAVRGLPFVGAHFGGAPLLGGNIAELVGLVRARGVALVVEHLELAAGGGVEVGGVLGTGIGISDPRSNAAPWVAIEAAAGISWVPTREFAVFLELEALVPVVRPVFTVSGLGVLYRPEPIAGALRLGIEVRAP